MNLRIYDQPTIEPFTLAEARLHLRLDATGSPATHPDDDLVESLITSAREAVEAFTGRAIVDAGYELRVDSFESYVDLPIAPVQSIVSVTYIDADGATQTLATSVYEFDDHPRQPKVRLKYGQTWPTLRGDPNGVHIRFVGGYTDNNSPNTNPMPEALKTAMKLMMTHWYENREAVNVGNSVTEIPMGAQYLMIPSRINMGV